MPAPRCVGGNSLRSNVKPRIVELRRSLMRRAGMRATWLECEAILAVRRTAPSRALVRAVASEAHCMSERLRVGVIGLGRLWEARYKPALLRRRDLFEVSAVSDQVAQRAAREAREIGCGVAFGIHELVDRPDVDALLLLTPQWFGLFPVDVCNTRGKPVFASIDWSMQRGELAPLAEKIRATQLLFMPELPRRFYPVTQRLRGLLANELGPARLIIGQTRTLGADRASEPGPTSQLAPARLLFDPGCNVIDWCGFVIGTPPTAIRRSSLNLEQYAPHGAQGDMEGIALQFENGAAADVWMGRFEPESWRAAMPFLPPQGFQVHAQHGIAWVEHPDRLCWSSPAGVREERLPMDPPIGEVMLANFHRAVIDGESTGPSIDDLLDVARLIEAIPD